MNSNILILYARKGCCLCEKLEERLRSLPLSKLTPPFHLQVLDINNPDMPDDLRCRYEMEIPILAIHLENDISQVELPRVSPRLKDEELLKWLKKAIKKNISLSL
tara:strand:+ start:741 stop:1055 length:315 start_codon:yes stop_codon:yes gene_type:complete